MVKTIQEFVEKKQTFVNILRKVVDSSLYEKHFNGVDIGNLVVMEDSDLCKIYEMFYLHSCHYAPFKLPGIGFAVGDYLSSEDKTYILYKLHIATIEMSFMHVFRAYEDLLCRWHVIANDVMKNVTKLEKYLKQHDPINPLLKIDFESYASWHQCVGIPSSMYFSTLKKLVLLKTFHKEQLELAKEILSACEPFADISEHINVLRRKLGCNGAPMMGCGYVGMSSPAASEPVSWFVTESEDLQNTIPLKNNFMVIAANARKLDIEALEYIVDTVRKDNMITFVTPKEFINTAQDIVDSNLFNEWENLEKVSVRDTAYDILEKYVEWSEIVLPHIKPLVKSVIPNMVSNRVLGINTNVADNEAKKVLLEPVVSRSYFEKNFRFIQENFQGITELKYDGFQG